MMLTPEQLEGLRFALEATVHAPGLSVEAAHGLFNHIDAQQARIAELEAKAGAGNEWRRAHDDVLASLNKARGRITELEQDAARYRSICRDVASEWGNFSGGADECLRRIEAYEQSKEAP